MSVENIYMFYKSLSCILWNVWRLMSIYAPDRLRNATSGMLSQF